VGISLAKKILGQTGRVWVLVGDGECQEGSVWEAARLAVDLELPISVIVDHNRTHGRYQLRGSPMRTLQTANDAASRGSLTEIWKSFGWGVFECSGHSEGALKNALQILSRGIIPWVLIAETVKGRGCPTMEEDPAAWHHRILSHEEFNGLMLEVV
jgi:transketolase